MSLNKKLDKMFEKQQLSEAKDKILNKLFIKSIKASVKDGEDKLYKLSQEWEDWNVDNDDKYDNLVDPLFAAIELVQDAGQPGKNNVTKDKEYYSYIKSAVKLLKQFNKDVAKAAKLHTEEIDEANVTGGGEAYDTPYAFGKKKKKDATVGLMGYTQVKESTFMKMAKLTLVNEVNYSEYKKDETASSKQKVNRAIKEVNSKLFKIERIINQNIKLKTETGIDENKYWKSTRENLSKISEKMERLSNKLRRF
tara:strand:- start:2064 stop:2819 length:756 start_codon:yes stop_codon:yes gene_type:complete